MSDRRELIKAKIKTVVQRLMPWELDKIVEAVICRGIPVTERLPEKDGSYLVYAPLSFPKNSRWMVAEFYTDNQTFYDEGGGEHALPDVTHWTDLPDEPAP